MSRLGCAVLVVLFGLACLTQPSDAKRSVTRASTVVTEKLLRRSSDEHAAVHFESLKTDRVYEPDITTTTEGYFERLKNSVAEFILGAIFFIFSIGFLWANERNYASIECLIGRAREACIEINVDKPDEQNRGKLVHVSGQLCGKQRVADSRFDGVSFETGCIRIQTTVEVFRWVETKTHTTQEKFGGGKETVTHYHYNKEWSQSFEPSDTFHTKEGHDNKAGPFLALGTDTANCGCVTIGAYEVPNALVNNLCQFKPAEEFLGESITCGDKVFSKIGKTKYFMLRADGMKDHNLSETEDKIGDIRVCFETVRDGPGTVVALQKEAEKGGSESFASYRPVHRSLCGWTPEKERAALLQEAGKTTDQLAKDRTCTLFPFNCLCCCCNLATMCLTAVATEEVMYISQAQETRTAAFENLESATGFRVWIFRFIGWLMMFLGLYGTFSPFITLLAVIPFLKSFGAMLIWVACLFSTLLFSLMIITAAYILYRPMVGIPMVAIVGLVMYAPLLFAAHHKAE